jgi:MFS family permease
MSVVVLYAINRLGSSPAAAAAVLTAAGAATLVSGWFAAGVISRFGPKRILVWTNVGQAVASALLPLWPQIGWLIASLVAIQVLGQWTGPAGQIYVRAYFVGDNRVELLAKLRVARNVGFAAGGLVAAGVLGLGAGHYWIGFAFDGLTFAFAAAISTRFRALPGPPRETRDVSLWSSLRDTLLAARHPVFLRALTAFTILAMGAGLFEVALPIQSADVGAFYGAALTANTLIVIALQVGVAKRLQRHSPRRNAALASLLLAVTIPVLVWSSHLTGGSLVGALAAAALLMTALELVASPIEWQYLDQMGDDAPTVSAWFTLRQVRSLLLPLLGVTLVSAASGPVIWLVLAALAVVIAPLAVSGRNEGRLVDA